jgi:hypothetical protein
MRIDGSSSDERLAERGARLEAHGDVARDPEAMQRDLGSAQLDVHRDLVLNWQAEDRLVTAEDDRLDDVNEPVGHASVACAVVVYQWVPPAGSEVAW